MGRGSSKLGAGGGKLLGVLKKHLAIDNLMK